MEVLVCVKRVPAPGPKIPLTPDEQEIDTRFLGFTIGPHEECAVEEAVQIVERHGGSSTVLTVGPAEADEQLRYAMSMGGIDRGVHVLTEENDWDPQATASAVIDAIRTLEAEGQRFDLILFGNETADSGNYQIGIRVAFGLGLPIVSGIKGIELAGDVVTLYRSIPDGFERYELPLPAAAAVKEGLNLPRYPAMKNRLRAKKAEIRMLQPKRRPGGLQKLRLHHPQQAEADTVILGAGAEAAPDVADVLKELGLI